MYLSQEPEREGKGSNTALSIRVKKRVKYSERCERWSISLCSGQQMLAVGHTLNAIWSTHVIYHLWQLGERETTKKEIKCGKRRADRLPQSPGACWGPDVLVSATLDARTNMWFSVIGKKIGMA